MHSTLNGIILPMIHIVCLQAAQGVRRRKRTPAAQSDRANQRAGCSAVQAPDVVTLERPFSRVFTHSRRWAAEFLCLKTYARRPILSLHPHARSLVAREIHVLYTCYRHCLLYVIDESTNFTLHTERNTVRRRSFDTTVAEHHNRSSGTSLVDREAR